MRTFTSLDEVAAATGTELGTSDWVEIDQDRIDRFAEATGDHQWIHVDAERAATGPFGATIAHGYLTLSLRAVPRQPGVRARDARAPSSTTASTRSASPPGARSARGSARTSRSARSPTCPPASSCCCSYTIEIEGVDKPACVAETVVLLLAD